MKIETSCKSVLYIWIHL